MLPRITRARLVIAALVAGTATFGLVRIAAAKPGKASFRASLDKPSYAAGEAILLSFGLKNEGKEPLWVNTRFYVGAKSLPEPHRDVVLIVTGPKGAELPSTYTHRTGFPKTDFFMRLAPGEEAASPQPRDLRTFFDLKEPGTYILQAVYLNSYGPELGLEAFTGPAKSKPVKFMISAQ
jgi:hypothetical protein